MFSRIGETDNPFQSYKEAWEADNISLLDNLLDQNPSIIHKTDKKGRTMLHILSKYSVHIEAANLLLAKGANIDAQDKKGRTPLYLSIKGNNIEFAEFLISNAADINIRRLTKNCESPLQYALLQGSIELVELLLDPFLPEDYESSVNTAKRCREIVDILLSPESDYNLPKTKFSPLLYFIIKFGDRDTLKLALRVCENYEINALSPENHPLLHYAVERGKRKFVKYLLEYGANINLKGSFNRTAMHYAVKARNIDMVRYLNKLEADYDEPTAYVYYTPLHYAALVQDRKIIQELVSEGAEINAKAIRGTTALHLVCGRSWTKQFDLNESILSYNEGHITLEPSDINDNVEDRPASFSLPCIKLLLDNLADPECIVGIQFGKKDPRPRTTPLQEACLAGRSDVVKLLIDNNAETDDKIRKYNSPHSTLYYTVRGGNPEILQMLLEHGMLIKSGKETDEKLLLYTICDNCFIPSLEMIEFLVDFGFDVNEKFSGELSAINHAFINDHFQALELFLTELKAEIQDSEILDGESLFHSFVDLTRQEMRGVRNEYPLKLNLSCKILIAFIVLKEGNSKKSRNNFSRRSNWEEVYSCFEKCRFERDELKKRKISDERDISLFDFLIKDLMSIVPFVKSKEVIKIFESDNYKEEFPSYKYFLFKRFARAKLMLNFMERTAAFLQENANVKLTPFITNKIISHFCAKDFRNLMRALRIFPIKNSESEEGFYSWNVARKKNIDYRCWF